MSSGGGGFNLPFLAELEHFVEGSNEGSGFTFIGYGLMIVFVLEVFTFFVFEPEQTVKNFQLTFFLAPLWLPLLLARWSIFQFVQGRRWNFNTQQPTVLLELLIPRDTMKSPLAMEAVFSSLHLGPGEGTWYKKYILGRTRPWWSFEIVSLGGRVHFYVWTRENMRRALESYLYAQYPGIEIIEAEDYSRLTDPNKPPHQLFACEYRFARPSPYPIKTFVDYGLDQTSLKVEQQVDPLAQMIELLGSIGPEEQVWVQMVVRLSKGEKYRGKKNKQGKTYTWRDEAKEIVDKLQEEATIKTEYVDKTTGEVREAQGFPRPTKGQSDTMAAIERNVGKLAFDVGIRGLYMAPKDKYYRTMNAYTANLFRVFSVSNYNEIKPAPLWSEKFNDYPWEDIGGIRQRREMHEVVELYRRRSYFHSPYRGPWLIMSTEELATLYHIPSSSVTTPNLPRIQSATSEAPANLPV